MSDDASWRVTGEAVFDAIDKDKSGSLDPNELLEFLLAAGQEPETVSLLFSQLDTNSDGVVDREEFLKGYGIYVGAIGRTDSPLTPALLRRIFERIDTTKSGTLSQTEVRTFTALLLESASALEPATEAQRAPSTA